MRAIRFIEDSSELDDRGLPARSSDVPFYMYGGASAALQAIHD
jgi:hypothetical protein